MKSRKVLSGIVGLIAIVSLGGCSLAVPDAGTDESGDRLIGAFITSEHLDLEQKLYATIDKSGGKDPDDWKITFGDISGINFFSPLWTEDGGEKYWGSITDEGICDTNIDINTSDTQEEHSLSGTIYFLEGQADKDIAYYANPVYQTADGKIYAVSEQGFSTSGESGEGEHFSTTLSGDVSVTEGGRTKTEKSSVTVNFATMYKPEKITLYQMDKKNRTVKMEEYKPGKLPEKIAAKENAEYILVKTEKETLAGKKEVSREIYDNKKDEDNMLETFYPMDNGIISKQETEIVWDRP